MNSLFYGFGSGFCIGCFPNRLDIHVENKKYKSVPIPLISGLICSVGLMVSPLLIINYFSNSTYFDKLMDKYIIDMEKYYQYDGKNNKYAYPSILILSIKSKHENNSN